MDDWRERHAENCSGETNQGTDDERVGGEEKKRRREKEKRENKKNWRNWKSEKGFAPGTACHELGAH